MKGWQSMKRIITVLALAAGILGLIAVGPTQATSPGIAPVAAPAPIAPVRAGIPVPAAVPPISGCVFTADYDLAFDNGLAWSTSDQEAFHTPMFRAGSCRHVMVLSYGVYNAPPCFYARVKTYNEDGTTRVRGPWVRFPSVGSIRDLRPTIDPRRLFRVYAYACEPFRARQFPPSFAIYAS